MNLLVVHDAPRQTTLTLPTADQPVQIPLHSFRLHHPIEYAAPLDADTWRTIHQCLLQQPGHHRLWEHAYRQLEQASPTPSSFIQQFGIIRRSMEQAIGAHLHDLSTASLSATRCFGRWILQWLQRPHALIQRYNRALAQYRTQHGFKGNARPVPDLAYTPPRLELPFWVYAPGQPRMRLWMACQTPPNTLENPPDANIQLFADQLPLGSIRLDQFQHALHSLPPGADWRQLLPPWPESGQPPAVRPRALTLTWFTRLYLADLFIHGIGGGKYDEMTDRMILDDAPLPALPPMAVVSATLRLADVDPLAIAGQARQARQTLRHWSILPPLPPLHQPAEQSDQLDQPDRPAPHENEEHRLRRQRSDLLQQLARLRPLRRAARSDRHSIYSQLRSVQARLRELHAATLESAREQAESLTVAASKAQTQASRESFLACFDDTDLTALRTRIDLALLPDAQTPA